MNYVPKPDLEEINSPRSQPLKDAAILIVGFVAVAGCLLFILGWMGELILSRISLEREAQIFSTVNWKSGSEVHESPEIEAIAGQLLPEERVKFRFGVLCSETANAFALPGARIHITASLLDEVKTVTGLAFVIAHEVGHVMNRHHLRGLGYQLGLALGSALLGIDLQSVSGGLLHTAMGRLHIQSNEHEADVFAIEAVKKAYGHLDGAAEFFEVRMKEEPKWKNRIPSLLETHPATPDRIRLIQEAARKTPPGPGHVHTLHQIKPDCP